ncbi:unnamed protein product [Agarophyton chilense]
MWPSRTPHSLRLVTANKPGWSPLSSSALQTLGFRKQILRIHLDFRTFMGISASNLSFAEGHCPVDHENMSEKQISAFMRSSESDNVHPTKPAAVSESKDEKSMCPVDHKNMSKEQIEAYMSKNKPPNTSQQRTEDTPGALKQTVYDVYGQEIDRTNMMPATPNQLPAPGQKQLLSTDREKSSIPKSGERGDTWTYPSPQMFYNSLKRKGKGDGVNEEDMNAVVSVHNTMNERTWKQVMDWERKYHCHQCHNPKLKSFMGRPHDLSPAAWFRSTFRGYPKPFDRHDWIIDRCGEQEARYIIDYYYRSGPDPIEIHVRPALDSPTALFDRMRDSLQRLRDYSLVESTSDQHLPGGTNKRQATVMMSGDQLDPSEFDFLRGLSSKRIREIADDVQKRCEKVSRAFAEAGDDPVKMEQANVSVNFCMAKTICERQATDFMSALESGHGESESYEKMTACLDRFHIMARRTLLEEAGVKQSGPEFPRGEPNSVDSDPRPAIASSVEQ